MKKKILVLSMVLALVAALVVPMAALADNEGTQNASTTALASTSITVVSKVGTDVVASITFPEGAGGATISDPWNDHDTSALPQVLHASTSEPVVRLLNGSGGDLIVWLGMSTWTNSVVASEYYNLATSGAVNILTVTTALTTTSTTTGTTLANGVYGDLYLKVILAATTGISGTSTLTVLGETP